MTSEPRACPVTPEELCEYADNLPAEWPLTRALRDLADWLPTPAAASEPTRGAEGFKMNNDPEWLRKKAEQEDGCDVSVGSPTTVKCSWCGGHLAYPQPASPAAPAPRVLTREQLQAAIVRGWCKPVIHDPIGRVDYIADEIMRLLEGA